MPRAGERPSPPRVVCVQGLGFAGAAMAVAVASAAGARGEPRYQVIGVDLPTPQGRERVACIDAGEFPFRTSDRELSRAAAEAHARGNLRAATDPASFAGADVVLIDVDLDVGGSGEQPAVDFAPFRRALSSVGAHVAPGTLVVIETTVPPGTTERIAAPELAAAFEARGLPRDGALLAHSYERVMPGEHYLASITNFWRVYAGLTPEAADACEAFLASVINVRDFPLRRLPTPTASELAKALENAYRATNIAFVDEWSRLAEAVGVDLFEVVEAIRVRPTHSNLREPGFGVGGYCLTKDPLLGGVAARQLFARPDLGFPFSELAIRTNRRMPDASLDRLEALLGGSLRDRRILLLGVAYRPEVADTRHSASRRFVEEARRRGAAVTAHDPLVTRWPELGLELPPGLPAASGFDAVVFAVAHRAYRELDLRAWLGSARPAILDAHAVLGGPQRAALAAAGCAFAATGVG